VDEPERVQLWNMRAQGKLLKILRVKHDLTQAQLGALAGVSHRFIGQLEDGSRGTSPEIAIAIAKALNVVPGQIFLGELPKDKEPVCA
jgi:DNA-binding XRE family transcriptional regulator